MARRRRNRDEENDDSRMAGPSSRHVPQAKGDKRKYECYFCGSSYRASKTRTRDVEVQMSEMLQAQSVLRQCRYVHKTLVDAWDDVEWLDTDEDYEKVEHYYLRVATCRECAEDMKRKAEAAQQRQVIIGLIVGFFVLVILIALIASA